MSKPADPRYGYWAKELKLTPDKLKRISVSILDQVDRCKSVEAQRLLIRGIKGDGRR